MDSNLDISGLIFDLDGTLLNTLLSIANSFNRTLEQLGHPPHPVADYRYFIGDGARQCAIRCLPETATSGTEIEKTLDLQRADYRENWQNDVAIYPGIGELLAQLNQLSVPIAVLSNKDHSFTQQCIGHFFPNIDFGIVLGYSFDIPHKPNPIGALAIARRLNLRQSTIALVGDTAMDMQTAAACNMISIGVLWGFRDQAELLAAGARVLVSMPHEIMSLVVDQRQ